MVSMSGEGSGPVGHFVACAIGNWQRASRARGEGGALHAALMGAGEGLGARAVRSAWLWLKTEDWLDGLWVLSHLPRTFPLARHPERKPAWI